MPCGCGIGSRPGAINPDKDVALITIPPPMMVANMRAGRLDGFCVGEPWNAKAVDEGLGFTAILSEEIWPGPSGKGARVCRGIFGDQSEFRESHA